MTSILLNNIDETTHARLRVRAAARNRSMEDEARDILRSVLGAEEAQPVHLGTAIHEIFAPLGGVELPEIQREPMREPPRFEA